MKAFAASLLGCLILFGCSSKDREMPMAGDPSGAHDETVAPSDQGLDPVSYAQVRTDAAWKTYWKNNWYFFESEENLKKFESNPTAYVTEDGRVQPERYQKVHDAR